MWRDFRGETAKAMYKGTIYGGVAITITAETADVLGANFPTGATASFLAWMATYYIQTSWRQVQTRPYEDQKDKEMLRQHMLYFEAKAGSILLRPRGIFTQRRAHKQYTNALAFAEHLQELKAIQRITEKDEAIRPKPYSGPLTTREKLKVFR